MIRRDDGKISKTLVFNAILGVVTLAQELSAVLDVLPPEFVNKVRPWLLVTTLVGNTILRYFTTGPISTPTKESKAKSQAKASGKPKKQ